MLKTKLSCGQVFVNLRDIKLTGYFYYKLFWSLANLYDLRASGLSKRDGGLDYQWELNYQIKKKHQWGTGLPN